MNEVKEVFATGPAMIVAQVLSLLHVIAACFATMAVLKKRNELGLSMLPTLLAVWLIPFLGPACVLLGLGRSRADARG